MNRLCFGDNLEVLKDVPDACVDLIYIDPPFFSQRNYTLPDGTVAFKDVWASRNDYLDMMRPRLIEMRRVLKDTGSFYLHCDPTMSHYLKTICDLIFGNKNFRNEIIWSYRTGGTTSKRWSKKHDVLLFYSKTKDFKFNCLKEKVYTKSKSRKPGIINYGQGNAEFFKDKGGVFNLVNMRDVWEISYINSQSKERLGYPTQKPETLLERIIMASSNEGDLVADFFCGCGTTLAVAERLGRSWIGVDSSIHAISYVMNRLKDVNYRFGTKNL